MNNMTRMEINGATYVSIDEHEKLLSEEKTKQKTGDGKFKMLGSSLLDRANVMAIGAVQLSEGYHVAKFSPDYLEKALKILKTIGCEKVAFAFKQDMPICMGNFVDGTVSGVIIAPMVVEEGG
jgi:hypothetical protein